MLVVFIFLLVPMDIHAVDADPAQTNLVDSETEFHADLDGDGKDELIRSFRINPPDGGFPRAFTVIESNGNIVKKIIGDERPDSVQAIDLDKNGKKELIILTAGGNHYTSISVYQYKDADYKAIFEEGSASGVIFEENADAPLIKIGRGDWKGKGGWDYASEPLWEVYKWIGERFEYSRNLSNTPLIGEKQDIKNSVENALLKTPLSKEGVPMLGVWIAGAKAETLLASDSPQAN